MNNTIKKFERLYNCSLQHPNHKCKIYKSIKDTNNDTLTENAVLIRLRQSRMIMNYHE
jgi:hypothetical protein